MNHDAMWPGQIRRDGHGNLWACTDQPKTTARWNRVTGWTRDYGATFRFSEGDDTAILWDIVDEPIRQPLPTKQVRIDGIGNVWQKRADGSWGNVMTLTRLTDDAVCELQVIWTPEDDQ